MADEVEIGNVGGDGVASEITLARLAATMELMARKKGISPEDVNKKLKQLSTATTDNTKSVEDGTTARTDNTKKLKKSTAALRKFGNSVGTSIISAFASVGQSAVNITTAFASGTDRLDAFASQVPLIGAYLGPLAGIFDDSFEAFQAVAGSGAAFNNSLTEMRSAAAGARMPLEQFTSLVAANSDKLAAFGGTATGGAQQIVSLNKALGSQREDLLNMGLSYEGINEALIDYQYLQRAGNRGVKLNQQQMAAQAEGAARYTKNLVTLGKLTGEDVKSQQAKIAAAQMDIAMQAKLAGLDKDAREKFDAEMILAAAMGGESMVNELKRQFLGMPPMTEEAALYVTQFGENVALVSSRLDGVHDANVTAADMAASSTDVMVQAIKNNAAAFGRLEPGLTAAAAGLDGPMATLADQLQQAGIQFTDYLDNGEVDEVKLRAAIETAKAESGARDATTDALVKQREALAATREAFELNIISPLMKAVSPALAALTGYLNDLANSEEFKDAMAGIGTMFKEFQPKVEAFVAAFKEDPMKALKDLGGNLLSGVGSMIGDALVSVITSPKVIAAMVGGVALLWGAKAITNKLGSMLGSVFSGGALGTNASGPRGGRPGRQAGRAGAGIGNFIGQMGAGVMKGAATGLKAFAAPQILLGAAILSGSIAIIAAGVAGATALMGLALPLFAEGLASFADIDGENLVQVAKGIGAVGLAFAAFGTGAVVGAIGNTIANLLDALPGKSPLEKLKEFASADLNTQNIINNAEAMVAYSDAMKGFDGGPGASVFNTLKAGLVEFLGGNSDPLAPLINFGATNIDPNGLIVSNAVAVKAYTDAMKDFDGGPSASVFTTLKAGLVEFLGGNSDPLAPLIKFGATNIDPNGLIVSNAAAVKAYADAMRDFPTDLPKGDVLAGFKNSMVDFLGGEDAFEPLRKFGEENLNTGGFLVSNSEAVTLFATAMKDFPTEFPKGDALAGFKSSMVDFLGGEDAFGPLRKFGETILDPLGNVKPNTDAAILFATAMQDFPTDMPSGDAFAGFKSGMVNFLGGDDAFAPLRKFGEILLDPSGNVGSNATAVKSFADAMKDFPTDLPNGDALSGFKNFAAGLIGGGGAFDPIKKFGEETFDGPSIIANAGILSEFSAAMSVFSSSGINSIEIPRNLASRLEDLNSVPASNLNLLASGMAAIANVTGLQSNLDILSSGLDTTNVTSYTSAMASLVEVLGELNDALSADNKVGLGTGTNAGDVINKMDSIGTGSNTNNDQLNTVMNNVLLTLEEMRDLDIKVERNTADMTGGFNIAARSPSRGG